MVRCPAGRTSTSASLLDDVIRLMADRSFQERLKHAVMIVASVVRNIHLKEILHEVDPEPRLNFWRVMYANCLDMAVIEWCKLFGSDSETKQQMHWKNIVPKAEHDKFRDGLLAATGLSTQKWYGYREWVKTYRDQQAAHFDPEFLERDPRYPDLGTALEAAYFYYDQLLAIMNTDGIAHRYPDDIRDYGRQFAEQAGQAAKVALGSTAAMRERVR
jgi:hypothetical protein